MILTSDILDFWVNAFGDSGAILTVLCGLMALIWFFYEGVRRGFVKPKNEAWERDKVSKILKIVIYLGIILGIICVISAIVTMVLDIPPSDAYAANTKYGFDNGFDWLTSITLLVMGLSMFLKPLEDVPIATIIGLAVGAAVALLLGLLLPTSLSDNAYMKWVLIGVFLIITTAVGAMLKVWLDGIEFIAKILSWPPVSMVLAAFCLVQGFAVWIAGTTLIHF
jgi:hypothetical protein